VWVVIGYKQGRTEELVPLSRREARRHACFVLGTNGRGMWATVISGASLVSARKYRVPERCHWKPHKEIMQESVSSYATCIFIQSWQDVSMHRGTGCRSYC
jgi:hypothetical protein